MTLFCQRGEKKLLRPTREKCLFKMQPRVDLQTIIKFLPASAKRKQKASATKTRQMQIHSRRHL